jgi:aspartyl-tRNA(Asn)/glutamyl-tRNA(Gln) amidotransferase subunit B
MNETVREKYEAVIGLEVHAQLLTNSKAYSSDVNEYGSTPNSNISPVTLGHPGTLPVMNKKTVEYAIKLGLAMNCEIADYQFFARKNYFYPDLPKGYQITQDKTPICTNGFIDLKSEDAKETRIGITRIHMEEDAGKSIHDVDIYDTLVDLNRAGTPLLEIVTEPDLRSSADAYQYLTEVRKLVRYLEICDGNMEEGSMRCDANISVRIKGATKLGTKVEVKNMNSIRNVQKAIEYEIIRQIEVLEAGGTLSQETRGFDALDNSTIAMRSKEAANDYRYFPEPDLQPLFVDEKQIAEIRSEMPALPKELFDKYVQEYKLTPYDANNLTDSKEIALFFEEIITHNKNYKSAANWIMGDVKSYLNENGVQIRELINLIDEGKVSSTAASQKIFPEMLKSQESVQEIAERLNIIQVSNEGELAGFIDEVIRSNTSEVERYKNGEKQLVGFFMGQLMKVSRGKADPKVANALLREKLNAI